jgi:hypothetical protein
MSRNGGRAVHGIVPTAFEFRWAQCRVGLPREWRRRTVRHSRQAGRRDARRWPMPFENDGQPRPPQGGEPERRRDERRTRRKAGPPEKRAEARYGRRGLPQRMRENQNQRQQTATGSAAATATANSGGPGTVSVSGHGHRSRGRSRTEPHQKTRSCGRASDSDGHQAQPRRPRFSATTWRLLHPIG